LKLSSSGQRHVEHVTKFMTFICASPALSTGIYSSCTSSICHSVDSCVLLLSRRSWSFHTSHTFDPFEDSWSSRPSPFIELVWIMSIEDSFDPPVIRAQPHQFVQVHEILNHGICPFYHDLKKAE